MTVPLSHDDVNRLLHENSPQNRESTAEKLATAFSAGGLSDSERRIAEDIFRVMVRDTAERVRRTLSEHLKTSADMPHDVAVALARDVDAVALPVLEFSQALTDADLIALVQDQGSSKRTAIARRGQVSAAVADVLIDSGDDTAVATLVGNDGAEISEPAMQRVLDQYGENDQVKDRMVHRTTLPVTVAERLVVMVADHLRDHLVVHHEIGRDMATDLILQARERATIGLLSLDAELAEVQRLVKQLHDHDRLTPSIILRALCMADVCFFEVSTAQRAGIPVENAQKLAHDAGRRGLRGLCLAARLPRAMLPAIETAIDYLDSTDIDLGMYDRAHYERCLLEAILTRYNGEIEADDVDYLLAQLTKQSDTAQVPATA